LDPACRSAGSRASVRCSSGIVDRLLRQDVKLLRVRRASRTRARRLPRTLGDGIFQEPPWGSASRPSVGRSTEKSRKSSSSPSSVQGESDRGSPGCVDRGQRGRTSPLALVRIVDRCAPCPKSVSQGGDSGGAANGADIAGRTRVDKQRGSGGAKRYLRGNGILSVDRRGVRIRRRVLRDSRAPLRRVLPRTRATEPSAGDRRRGCVESTAGRSDRQRTHPPTNRHEAIVPREIRTGVEKFWRITLREKAAHEGLEGVPAGAWCRRCT